MLELIFRTRRMSDNPPPYTSQVSSTNPPPPPYTSQVADSNPTGRQPPTGCGAMAIIRDYLRISTSSSYYDRISSRGASAASSHRKYTMRRDENNNYHHTRRTPRSSNRNHRRTQRTRASGSPSRAHRSHRAHREPQPSAGPSRPPTSSPPTSPPNTSLPRPSPQTSTRTDASIPAGEPEPQTPPRSPKTTKTPSNLSRLMRLLPQGGLYHLACFHHQLTCTRTKMGDPSHAIFLQDLDDLAYAPCTIDTNRWSNPCASCREYWASPPPGSGEEQLPRLGSFYSHLPEFVDELVCGIGAGGRGGRKKTGNVSLEQLMEKDSHTVGVLKALFVCDIYMQGILPARRAGLEPDEYFDRFLERCGRLCDLGWLRRVFDYFLDRSRLGPGVWTPDAEN
ncbi:uncharacterized protein BO97DRAFT_419714 [Aspergillus homomorphus CBS 101889]|uniref:Uncharacterized protein n=1 Tax=Aspergillus homomorphus (strain CBS 101889) TaxID=1450537 RepID=A0A395IBV2_ASPHC|nr:hypothetical protein BO97DRAFT_419714 [Aspergillus homomorphus CBS 101889]RAL17475.1 hypothetical protein BO97DRAFT_419714 [Aspergillus homomorphus CBS 101889]